MSLLLKQGANRTIRIGPIIDYTTGQFHNAAATAKVFRGATMIGSAITGTGNVGLGFFTIPLTGTTHLGTPGEIFIEITTGNQDASWGGSATVLEPAAYDSYVDGVNPPLTAAAVWSYGSGRTVTGLTTNAIGTQSIAAAAISPSHFQSGVVNSTLLDATAVDEIWGRNMSLSAPTAGSFGRVIQDNLNATISGVNANIGALPAAVWGVATKQITSLTSGALGQIWEYNEGSISAGIGNIIKTNLDAKVSTAGGDSAATIWAFGSRTLSAFDGIAEEVWNHLVSAIATTNSIGKRLVDNVNVAVSSRSSHTAADVWAVGSRALTDKSGFSLSAAGVVAIWSELAASHTGTTTLGGRIATNLNAAVTSRGTANPGDNMGLTAGAIDLIWDEPQSGHAVSGTFGFNLDVPVSSVAAGSYPTVQQITNGVWNELASLHQNTGTFGKAIGNPGVSANTIWGLCNTNLNAQVTSRSSHTASDIWAVGTRTITGGTISTNADKTGYQLFSNVGKTTLDFLNNLSATEVWSHVSRGLTTYAGAGVEVWSNHPSRTITGGTLSGNVNCDLRAILGEGLTGPSVRLNFQNFYNNNSQSTGKVVDDVGEAQSSATALRAKAVGPAIAEIPTSGTLDFVMFFLTNDATGNAADLDSLATVTVTNAQGDPPAGAVSVVTNPVTGEYRVTYTVDSTDPEESVNFSWSGDMAGDTLRDLHTLSVVADTSLTDWTGSEREQIRNVLGISGPDTTQPDGDGTIDSIATNVWNGTVNPSRVITGGTITTNNDKVGYFISGTKTTLDVLQDFSIDALLAEQLNELGVGSPPATPSFEQAMMLLYMGFRNHYANTAEERRLYNAAGTLVARGDLSDDGVTFDRGALISP
jgi:hypothetical protein